MKIENDDDDASSAKRIKLELPGEKPLKEKVRSTGPTKVPGQCNLLSYVTNLHPVLGCCLIIII